MKSLTLLLALTACGSPFSGIIPPGDSGSEASDPDVITRTDAHRDGRAIEHDSGHESGHDSGTEGSAKDAPGSETQPYDSGTESGDAVSLPEDASSPDTGPCMTTTTTGSYDIFQGGSMFSDYPTPMECQCVTTYTCACLSKYATGCMSGDSPTGTCSTTGPGTIVVNCGP